MTVNQVRECVRVERMKNGADVKSTDAEVCRARIQFDVTRKEKKRRGPKIGLRKPRYRINHCYSAHSEFASI